MLPCGLNEASDIGLNTCRWREFRSHRGFGERAMLFGMDRKLIALLLIYASMSSGQIPTPSIPGPYSSCLPANMAGPQLPICFTRQRAAGTFPAGAGIGLSVGLSFGAYYIARVIIKARAAHRNRARQ